MYVHTSEKNAAIQRTDLLSFLRVELNKMFADFDKKIDINKIFVAVNHITSKCF